MTKPLAPIVLGPITPASTHVQVSGALPGAEVVILAGGTGVGRQTAVAPGSLWVPLSSPLLSGQLITATQSNAAGSSEPSNVPVPVLRIPDPLPAPVYISPLSPCMTRVRLDALVPGATVRVKVNGQVLAETAVIQATEWLGLDQNIALPPGARLETTQEISLGAQLLTSPSVAGMPIPPFGHEIELLPPPGITEPLQACETSLAFFNMVPAADVLIENEGQTAEWTNVAAAYTGWGGPPLREGKLIARQRFPRCERESEEAVYRVKPPVAPPAPVVTQGYCPDNKRLQVSNLKPGAILHVSALIPQGGGAWSIVELGEIGIGASAEPVDLPSSFVLDSPNGPAALELYQHLCGIQSPLTRVNVVAPGGPYPVPRIRGDLFDCARSVPIQGAHPGSLVQVFSTSGIPRSGAVVAVAAAMVLNLWLPLVEGEEIYLRQTGCNASGDSTPPVPVLALPHPLPRPQIVAPVRPSAATVLADGIVPGATVYLLVNGLVRGSVVVLDKQAAIPTGSPPLVERDQLFAIQTLCQLSSPPEGQTVPVTKGHMKVEVTPDTAQRGSTTSVTVSAADADTGQPIAGAQVLLNNVVVGKTGQPFAYTPKAGDPNPAGLVREPVAHFDSGFNITLKDPPPKPKGILSLAAGPVTLAIGLKITAVSWTVTPLWGAPALALSGANASGTLPDPPAPSGQFTVSGTIAANANGWINGAYFDNQTWNTAVPAATFVWEGKNLGLGWLVLWAMYTDDYGNALIQLNPQYAGPQ